MRKKLTTAREERGLTQQQVAEALDVSPGAVSHWETGRATPDATHLLRLADLVGLHPRECLEDA